MANTTVLPDVHLVDMFDWLTQEHNKMVITFDAGPGQMMMKAKNFMALLADGFTPPVCGLREKVTMLMALYRDGEERLRKNRERDQQIYERMFSDFCAELSFEDWVEAVRQGELHIS